MPLIQSLLSLTILIIASVYDLKTREVPNKVWILSIPISIISTIYQILIEPEQSGLILFSIAITTLVAIAIFYLGFYGGADAKALITLALTHPTGLNQGLVLPVLPFTAFFNSLVLMTLTCPLALIKNFYWKQREGRPLFHGLEKEPAWKKALALLLCVKKSKSSIKPYDILAERLETVDGEQKRTLKIFQRVKDEDTMENAILEEAFVAYSLPMLPFLALGYFLAITIGDLILHLITILLYLG